VSVSDIAGLKLKFAAGSKDAQITGAVAGVVSLLVAATWSPESWLSELSGTSPRFGVKSGAIPLRGRRVTQEFAGDCALSSPGRSKNAAKTKVIMAAQLALAGEYLRIALLVVRIDS